MAMETMRKSDLEEMIDERVDRELRRRQGSSWVSENVRAAFGAMRGDDKGVPGGRQVRPLRRKVIRARTLRGESGVSPRRAAGSRVAVVVLAGLLPAPLAAGDLLVQSLPLAEPASCHGSH